MFWNERSPCVNFVNYSLKVDLLKNKFGFDDAFNYKEEPDLNAALKRLVFFSLQEGLKFQMGFSFLCITSQNPDQECDNLCSA